MQHAVALIGQERMAQHVETGGTLLRLGQEALTLRLARLAPAMALRPSLQVPREAHPSTQRFGQCCDRPASPRHGLARGPTWRALVRETIAQVLSQSGSQSPVGRPLQSDPGLALPTHIDFGPGAALSRCLVELP